MRTECKGCKHRNTDESYCSKDNAMKQDGFLMCIKYNCDFSIKKELKYIEESGKFSQEFLMRRSKLGGYSKEEIEEGFNNFLKSGGHWSLNNNK